MRVACRVGDVGMVHAWATDVRVGGAWFAGSEREFSASYSVRLTAEASR